MTVEKIDSIIRRDFLDLGCHPIHLESVKRDTRVFR